MVDATDTLQAFHMTGADGSYAGHRKQDGAALHNTGLFQQRDGTGCIFTSCAHYRTVWQLNGPRQGAGRGPALAIQQVQPPAELEEFEARTQAWTEAVTGAVRPIDGAVFRSNCKADIDYDARDPRAAHRVAHFPSAEQAHAFSFALFLAQACRMLIFVDAKSVEHGGQAAAWNAAVSARQEFFRTNIVGSGVLQKGTPEEMWVVAGCAAVYPGFRVDSKRDQALADAGVASDRLESFALPRERWAC